jgi:putative metalloprotease
MRNFFVCFCLLVVAFVLSTSPAEAQLGKLKFDQKKIDAATKTVQALTLTDEDMAAYCREYVDWMDKHNPVCDDFELEKKKYADRLAKIIAGHETENGIKLDIKVYYVVEQNAFSCANGSIRVLAGLMDVMTDDELLGIIGHEIGHIINKDCKDAFRTALLTSALKDVTASTGKTAAALSDSQLGELGEALANSQFSQKQEYAADDYGYDFLKKSGKDPKAMASALRVIQKLQGDAKDNKLNQLLSSHPNSDKRAERLENK